MHLEFYQAERGTKGKICSSGIYCNDTVTRTTTWTGYIATDWAYASENSICETNMQVQASSNNFICNNNNWMQRRGWTLSPSAFTINANYVWYVDGLPNFTNASNALADAVFPAIYLKSNVLIERGTGSETNPYTLSIK